jgi:protein-disulfide isomerase
VADARKPGESKRDAARRRIAEKRAAEAAARARAQRRRRGVLGGVAALVVLVVAVVVTVLVQSSRTSTDANAAVPAHAIDGGTVVAVGDPSAPVTVDLYEDLQCPNCQAFEQQSGSTLASLVSQKRVVLHYHPMAFLDNATNDRYSTRALDAAAAVLDAAGPQAFQRFHDLLYAHQPPETGTGLTDQQLIDYAAQAGASGAAVQRHIRDLTYGDWTRKVTDQASKDGVNATPTVLVGGRQVTDLTPSGITAAVTAAAKR